MFIPYRVDVPYDRRPFVNWLIIGGTVAVLVCQLILFHFRVAGLAEIAAIMKGFVLHGFSFKGLIGHVWLHGGILHLVGNMLFLWVFGNAVCAKIGNVFYLPIYLVLGAMAGIAHIVFVGGPLIGASGAINGIVGMYLVFFPLNNIDCLFLFFIPLMVRPIAKTFTVSSYWMILLWFVFDIWGAMKGGGRVAYFAHLGGFASGVVLAVIMLKAKWIAMESYEKSLLQLIGLDKSETDESVRSGLEPWQQQYPVSDAMQPESEATPLTPQEPEAELETIPLGPEKPKEEFILFACPCGKRFKMPAGYAGRTGRCPKCQGRIKIPEKTRAEAEALPSVAEKPREDLIRFTCSCGKGLKVPLGSAGRTGRCPKCKKLVKIPEKPLI